MVTPMSGRTGAIRRPAASGAAEHDSRAGLAFQPDQQGPGVPITVGWPCHSYLELGALPSAVPCARLHTRQILWEWGLGKAAETAELLVSEIVTNAVRASAGLATGQHDTVRSADPPTVRFWLAADSRNVLIQVWDGCHWKPQPREPDIQAESGRGLLLVETLSSSWGSFTPNGWTGKIVWALLANADLLGERMDGAVGT
jgi:anti-sigma regulatory factor (Ser/Thr protein kinase)